MLIKRDVLDRIVSGDIDLVFRRWKRPTVRTGGTLRTAIGMLEIVSVDRTSKRRITADDARRAGYATRSDLVSALDRRTTGDIYRIQVRPGGTDPLIILRSDAHLTPTDIDAITARLDAMDHRSATGPWTSTYLALIGDHPHVRAEDLADAIGLEKPTFKANVRKLKALGLTISHSPGYELSPRGIAYLAQRASP